MSIYPLFDKNIRIYRILGSLRGQTITISNAFGYVEARRIVKENFALLPAILLQNAIKYAT
jgi:hypothetical protein